MAVRQSEHVQPPKRGEALRASPRMFDSDLLDKLSSVHPIVPPLIFGPAIAFGVVYGVIQGAGWLTLAWLAGGYAFWTLAEYWIHRVVFHFEPERGIGARIHWIIHGVHHDHPNDPMRLVMPPSASIPLATLFVVIWQLVFGYGGGWAVSAGFLTGYLSYDMTHYFVHHGKIGRAHV